MILFITWKCWLAILHIDHHILVASDTCQSSENYKITVLTNPQKTATKPCYINDYVLVISHMQNNSDVTKKALKLTVIFNKTKTELEIKHKLSNHIKARRYTLHGG